MTAVAKALAGAALALVLLSTVTPAGAEAHAVALVGAALIAIMFVQGTRRRDADRSLTERLRCEEFASKLYAAFVHSAAADVGHDAMRALEEVSEFLGVDRATLLLPHDASGSFRLRSWARPGVERGPAVVAREQFPWAAARLRQGQIVRFSSLGDLPAEAAVDRQSFRSMGTRSHVSIPLVAVDTVVGSISFSTVHRERAWPDALLQRLELMADVLASVLALRRADGKLRQSRALSVAILDSLPDAVVVIDRSGRIIAANAWRGDATRPHPELVHGTDYLALWRTRVTAGDREAADLLLGIEAVLRATRTHFSMEYRQPGETAAPWFEFRVYPLRMAIGGAVVARIDIEDRKRAEAEARQVREELARFGRVATAGQLAAALTHEVKQPLAGILSNAQAAQRLLAAPAPDLDEFRAIVDDIIQDDQRAGAVLQRLRGMLKRREPVPAPVTIDVKRLIEDVVRFLHSDALGRHATVVCDLAPDLPAIQGDVVQLQQVLVNLVLNGLDAMRAVPVPRRQLRISSTLAVDRILVSVRDAGTGIPEPLARIFEPFYTSKAEGMGMGLPIARSIVEAHGGRLWADNNADGGGATFWFTVPIIARTAGDVSRARPTANAADVP